MPAPPGTSGRPGCGPGCAATGGCRSRVRVVSITEQADDTPTGKLLEAIIESVDEFYSENLDTDIEVITATNLTKKYSDLVAVDSIDFSVSKGECFGLLGPNGAGKTSIMKMACCVSPVTSGDLFVQGKKVMRDKRAVKSVLGVVSQADSLDPGLNVMQNLLAYARFFDLPGKQASERAWAALDLFQLREKVCQSTDELSGGMRRRLLIGRALLHDPSILILDEPTTGLDPQSRHLVWDRLLQLKQQGITMLLTTHYMDEAASS